MTRSLTKVTRITPPPELTRLFSDPPLVGKESREDYERLFISIANAAKPADSIAWLFVRDLTDLSWEIIRERKLKQQVLNYSYRQEIRRLLTPPRDSEALGQLMTFFPSPEAQKIASEVDEKVKQWANDPKARQKIEKGLADQGHDAASISRMAQVACDEQVDAIDRRIASYELRRMAALRMVENYNEALSRRLKAASADVIDAEFTEAAE
jgi:hypothetical protein